MKAWIRPRKEIEIGRKLTSESAASFVAVTESLLCAAPRVVKASVLA